MHSPYRPSRIGRTGDFHVITVNTIFLSLSLSFSPREKERERETLQIADVPAAEPPRGAERGGVAPRW